MPLSTMRDRTLRQVRTLSMRKVRLFEKMAHADNGQMLVVGLIVQCERDDMERPASK